MMNFEDDAIRIVSEAEAAYEESFGVRFPVELYQDITRNEYYDFSIEGARRLNVIILKAVADGKPVDTPEDFYRRQY
ncbi:hypothetical protein [Lacticaseibacillus brantae]|uniref:Uncharacterized protein n=1 Tax=Lacticaseibacillus brantae DSM 23927 TaxID=1423727 RepID=A0A0R2B7R0_9LACO|nr:hypothetical protein [Lacticaseibacillus brantae]KRM72134.1 hypothetical protein FC34_GL001118 [Lacticaseibacillus brantae DSM 23927]